MTVFYAYIHNILDDNTWRMLMVFSSRSVADEWWRAISESDNATSFQRINAQFYTHNPNVRNMYEFFYSPYFKDINGAFRGKLFLTLLADRGGRDLSIIPNQEYTDHISGNWFYIRSKSNPSLYWCIINQRLYASEKHRTQFQIRGRDLKDGTVMIGSDTITFQAEDGCTVNVDGDARLVESGAPYQFRFDDLEKGSVFINGNDMGLYFNVQQRPGQNKWELV
ncbi:hypothetical protein BJ165DRAFT_1501037 [Panaeolus papilionaceus]|nr:hypothetical protein BJ165DRAFT_1501037 [Panaeolus papilionaceus]